MAYQPDCLARVRARVEQGFAQGLRRRFLRVCKGCNRSAYPCLTCMCAHARLCVRVSLHETLATFATLAPSLSTSFLFSTLACRYPARVAQGYGSECKGMTPPGGVYSGEGARALDRIPSHSEIFYPRGGFSTRRPVIASPYGDRTALSAIGDRAKCAGHLTLAHGACSGCRRRTGPIGSVIILGAASRRINCNAAEARS